MVTAYAKGYRRERLAVEALERAGYHVVRAAGSHGIFDLVAWRGKRIRLIQIKSNGLPGPTERDEMVKEWRRCRAGDYGVCVTCEGWSYYDGKGIPRIVLYPECREIQRQRTRKKGEKESDFVGDLACQEC